MSQSQISGWRRVSRSRLLAPIIALMLTTGVLLATTAMTTSAGTSSAPEVLISDVPTVDAASAGGPVRSGTAADAAPSRTMYAARSVAVRNGAGIDGTTVIGRLGNHQQILAGDDVRGWVPVRAGDTYGWVPTDALVDAT